MLTMRKRGKKGIYYIRGTVSYGGKSVDIKEFSSGTSERDAASHLKAERENEERDRLVFGAKSVLARSLISDAFVAYLAKPKKPNSSDIIRVGMLNSVIGNAPVSDCHAAWEKFRSTEISEHAPAGQDRYRSTLQSAINYYLGTLNMDPIKIRSIKFKNERVRFLSPEDAERLIRSYALHVQPIIVVLAFQGPRTQDALQLRWGAQGVDPVNGTIWIWDAKSDSYRMVPMHPRVQKVLFALWEKRGRPTSGHVFLNRLGNPYQDTRKAKIQGGNPLKSVHKTACRKAGIDDFTVHDWRHHWASHCMMAGMDIESLRRLGGWSDYRMLQRYAAVSAEHLRSAIGKLGA